MSNPYRLFSERWIIENYNGGQIILNYCSVHKPNAWGAKILTFKLDMERSSPDYLVFNGRSFNYFACNIVYLPPNLTWHRLKTLPNGNIIFVITKIDPLRDPPIENR